MCHDYVLLLSACPNLRDRASNHSQRITRNKQTERKEPPCAFRNPAIHRGVVQVSIFAAEVRKREKVDDETCSSHDVSIQRQR